MPNHLAGGGFDGRDPAEVGEGRLASQPLGVVFKATINRVAALYRIVIVRLRWHQPTKDYMARRTAEGKSKKEIIRCLKRYVAREVFPVLREMNQADPATAA